MWGENKETINQYAKDVYETNKKDLDQSLVCYKDLVRQAELILTKKWPRTQFKGPNNGID